MLDNRRFEGLQAQTGMSSNSLAARLKALEKSKVIRRLRYNDKPARFEYRVTARGFDLWPVLVSLTVWGDKWMNPRRSSLQYMHKNCDHVAEPRFICGACEVPLDAAKVKPLMSRKMNSDRNAEERSDTRCASYGPRSIKDCIAA